MSAGLLVSSEPTDDGGYAITITVDDDHIWSLDADQAVAYARAVTLVAHAADYEAAIFAQLAKQDVPLDVVGQVVFRLRQGREIDDTGTAPLQWRCGVNPEFKPFVVMSLGGKPLGQITPGEAREHAYALLEILAVCQLDTDYRHELVSIVGLPDRKARRAVADLDLFRFRDAGPA